MSKLALLAGFAALALALGPGAYADTSAMPSSASGGMDSSGITNPSGMSTADNATVRAQSQSDRAAAKSQAQTSESRTAGGTTSPSSAMSGTTTGSTTLGTAPLSNGVNSGAGAKP
jgi:hypothetical protein